MTMNSLNDRIAEATEDAADSGYILGTVVDNNDPLGLGRVKVSIPNLFDLAHGEIPWIGAHKKSPFGIGPGYGVYGSPAVGSQVKVKLQDGDAHYGIAEADEYSKANANPKFKDPKTWGFKDPSGNELFVNMDTQDWQFTSSGGITIQKDIDGNLKVHVPGNSETTVLGDSTTTVQGDLNTTVHGNINTTITGNQNTVFDGSADTTVEGDATVATENLTITVTGNLNVIASGSAQVTAASISLTSAGPLVVTGNPVSFN